jgi:iron complex outermembrane receptor protein
MKMTIVSCARLLIATVLKAAGIFSIQSPSTQIALACASATIISLGAPTGAHAESAVQNSASTTATASPPHEEFQEIIVTGTRDPKATASQSASPIEVVGAAQLERTGEPDLRDALVDLSPSVTRTSQSPTNANTVEKVNLRALSSNHTLVLLNGLRRHTSSVIDDSSGPEQGSSTVDIGLFPSSAIGRVEVLLDGASAQYGSDAIAGVINFLLKKDDHGVTVTSSNGEYYAGDGFTSNTTFNAGTKLGGSGFLNLSGEYLHAEHTNRGRPDDRVGARLNPFFGNPSQDRASFSYNAGIDFSDAFQIYSFATVAHREASTFQNYRPPNRLPQVYPDGFTPTTTATENDFSITGGMKGTVVSWDWDVSATYGKDHIGNVTSDTANVSLFNDTGYTPTSVFTQGYGDSQLTVDAALRRSISIGMAEPANFALGVEYRRDTYQVEPGEPDSYYGSGTQGQGGLNQFSAVDASRNVQAAYVDIATKPVTGFQVDVAGRYEKYSDAGNATTGKLSLREDLSPAVAIRGTASTGFRGASMPEQYFTSLAVSPTGGGGTLAVNSAAARFLGAVPLKPEKSTNFSAGLVFRPADKTTMTIDAYQITIRDRIVTGGSVNGQRAIDALALIGASFLPGTDPNAVSAQFSTNGVDTRTRGVEFALNHISQFDGVTVDWDASANLNNTKILRIADDQNGNPLVIPLNQPSLTTSFPRTKSVVGGVLTRNKFDFALHEIFWGGTTTNRQFVSGVNAFSNSIYWVQDNQPRVQTNIEFGYRFADWIKLSVGATNLFNSHPTEVPTNTAFASVPRYDYNSQQIGINGGYYYATVGVNF